MSFATIKEQQASRKFELAKVSASRYIVDDLTSIGGGKYTYPCSYIITGVKELGVTLTSVLTTPSIGQYFYDETNSLITIYPSVAPSTTNPIIIDYDLLLTGEIYRTWYQDPEDTGTTLRDWQPLLVQSPNVIQSVENLLQGVLTISSSTIEIVNNSYDFNQYFTDNDSFFNREVKIWLCLNDETNIQKIFVGRVIGATIAKDFVTLLVRDNMALLDTPALMGDNVKESYFRLDDYANLDVNKNGSVRFFITGTCSRYQTLKENVTNLPAAQKLDYQTLYQSICTNVNANISNTVNRAWGICRSSSFQNIGFTSTGVNNADPNYTIISASAGNIAKIYVGDTFVITQGVDYYARVYYVDRVNNYFYTNPIGVVGTPTITTNNCPSIVILQNNEVYYCKYGRDYTAALTVTSGGNFKLDITFTTTLEANLGISALDPTNDSVFFRVRPAIYQHGDFIAKMLDSIGLSYNAASITAANSALTANIALSIPKFDESDYANYYDYFGHVLSSTFGYIFLDNNFDIQYKLFNSPSSSDEISDTDIEKDSYSIDIVYQDIITQLIAYNSHANSTDFVAKTGTSLESLKAQYLHGITRTTRFEHCLDDITGRLASILAYRSNRLARYNLATLLKNIDSQIGDDFNLVKNGLLGELNKQLKLISIDKSAKGTKLILTDLGV